MTGFHIVLENSSGCELDGRFAKDENDIKKAIEALVRDCDFAPGDVIRVIEVV